MRTGVVASTWPGRPTKASKSEIIL